METSYSQEKTSLSLIDARIMKLGDRPGGMLSRRPALTREADPDAVEKWTWRGVPVRYHDGIICTGQSYNGKMKLTFARGASLEDPASLFKASFDGNTRRAIDSHEGDAIDENALKVLVEAAVALSVSRTGTAPAHQKGRSG